MSTLSPPMLHRLDLASHYIALGYRRARRIKQAENEQAARDFNEHAQQALNLARPLVVLPAPTLREWLDKAFDRIARDEAEDIDDQRRAASQEWSA